MKKSFYSKIRKITSAFIVATISMSLMAAAPASAEFGQYDSTVENIETVTDNIFEIQRKACEAHELLYLSFGWDETYIYPDDFGGDFIDYDTLHVQVTDESAIDYYKNLLVNYESNVVFDVVEYSYNELQVATNNIAEEIKGDYNVVSYGVCMSKNKGTIEVLKSDYEKVVSLKDNMALFQTDENDRISSMIEIESTDKVVQTEVSVIAGTPIVSNGFSLTLGGSGTYSGNTAFVTSGHNMAVGQAVKSGNSTIGTLTIKQYENTSSKYGDYSIISAAAGYSATSSVLTTGGGATSFNGYMLNPTEGTYLYKYGAVSGQAYCKVTKCNQTENNTSGLTKASIESGSSTGGDSGGSYRCGREFCGVHHGSNGVSVWFTPYKYIYERGFNIAY